MSELEIQKTLILSTGHITLEDSLKLGRGSTAIICDTGAYNWSVYVGMDDIEERYSSVEDEGFSAAFISAMKLAHANDCVWVKFDQDGPYVEQLATFDW